MRSDFASRTSHCSKLGRLSMPLGSREKNGWDFHSKGRIVYPASASSAALATLVALRRAPVSAMYSRVSALEPARPEDDAIVHAACGRGSRSGKPRRAMSEREA